MIFKCIDNNGKHQNSKSNNIFYEEWIEDQGRPFRILIDGAETGLQTGLICDRFTMIMMMVMNKVENDF